LQGTYQSHDGEQEYQEDQYSLPGSNSQYSHDE
jgi:hypothetical protein